MARGLDRQHAVDHLAGEAQVIRRVAHLLELLCEHAEITAHLDREALVRLCDPANYLGQSGVMVDRVLSKLR